MTHVIEITRIPFSDVMAPSATSVLSTAFAFLIKEKQRKNSCSEDPPKAREKTSGWKVLLSQWLIINNNNKKHFSEC